MTKTYKALRSAYAIAIYEVDGIPLSAEEVDLANLLVDKLSRTAKSSVIDFNRASKRRLKGSRSGNGSRYLNHR
jgi:hypothetical protein